MLLQQCDLQHHEALWVSRNGVCTKTRKAGGYYASRRSIHTLVVLELHFKSSGAHLCDRRVQEPRALQLCNSTAACTRPVKGAGRAQGAGGASARAWQRKPACSETAMACLW